MTTDHTTEISSTEVAPMFAQLLATPTAAPAPKTKLDKLRERADKLEAVYTKDTNNQEAKAKWQAAEEAYTDAKQAAESSAAVQPAVKAPKEPKMTAVRRTAKTPLDVWHSAPSNAKAEVLRILTTSPKLRASGRCGINWGGTAKDNNLDSKILNSAGYYFWKLNHAAWTQEAEVTAIIQAAADAAQSDADAEVITSEAEVI